MADINLKTNQDMILRLKGCGLSNAEINKIIKALMPRIENKADKATTLAGYGITDAYTKQATAQIVDERISYPIGELAYVVDKKAMIDLSNVDNNDFLAKLNEVLPNGDEVSY